jgi:chromosome partitioning protein
MNRNAFHHGELDGLAGWGSLERWIGCKMPRHRGRLTRRVLAHKDETMRRIAIINQKGGVGKTTTAVNLAAALADCGQRVCVIDLDPQAHATSHLGIEPNGKSASLYDVLVDSRPLAEIRRKVSDNLWIAASDINLAAAEVELAGVVGREVILRDLLLQDEGSFDFIIMDCGPSLGVLTLNALAAAGEVFIPLQPHFLALHGMGKLLETTALVARRLNPSLKVTGIILSLCETSTRLAQEVIRDLGEYLESARGSNAPWANARIFQSRIRRNIKLAECPSFGQSIFTYAPTCHGAEDYANLAREVLGGAVPEVLATRVELDQRGLPAVVSVESAALPG